MPIPQKDPRHQSSAAQLFYYSSCCVWVNQETSNSVLNNPAGCWSPKATSPNSFHLKRIELKKTTEALEQISLARSIPHQNFTILYYNRSGTTTRCCNSSCNSVGRNWLGPSVASSATSGIWRQRVSFKCDNCNPFQWRIITRAWRVQIQWSRSEEFWKHVMRLTCYISQNPLLLSPWCSMTRMHSCKMVRMHSCKMARMPVSFWDPQAFL
jgi:hypothetical protein